MSTIPAATKHGAKFARRGKEWVASAYAKGRALPLVEFVATTQEQAAAMYADYFKLRGKRKDAM